MRPRTKPEVECCPTAFDHKYILSILLLLITINILKLFIDLLDGFCPIAFDHLKLVMKAKKKLPTLNNYLLDGIDIKDLFNWHFFFLIAVNSIFI